MKGRAEEKEREEDGNKTQRREARDRCPTVLEARLSRMDGASGMTKSFGVVTEEAEEHDDPRERC